MCDEQGSKARGEEEGTGVPQSPWRFPPSPQGDLLGPTSQWWPPEDHAFNLGAEWRCIHSDWYMGLVYRWRLGDWQLGEMGHKLGTSRCLGWHVVVVYWGFMRHTDSITPEKSVVALSIVT